MAFAHLGLKRGAVAHTARLCKVTHTYVYQIATGSRKIVSQKAQRIARELKKRGWSGPHSPQEAP